MALIDRIKNICLTPNTEWPVIAAEPSSTGSLITGYVVPLAAIGAIAGFIGGSIVGRSGFFTGTYRIPMGTGLGIACYTFVASLIGVFVISFIINALAPTFGGEQNSDRAMKVAVYSYTPAWVAGALQIVPALGAIAILAGLYGLYLLYLGLPVLMKAPQDKAIAYTLVTVVCAIVLTIVIASVGAMIGFGAMGMGAAMGSLGSSGGVLGNVGSSSATAPTSEVQFDKNSPLGRLQEMGKAMEESNKKVEAAQKSGDQNAAAAAAMEGLGALLGGGKKVDPLEIAQIRSFLPPSLGALNKEGNGMAEKSGFGALMISRAEATYTDSGTKQVKVEVADPGGATGLVGLASWANIQTSKEDDNGVERVSKVNGRTVHEKSVKNGQNEYAVIVGNRFVVSATSDSVALPQLRSMVNALDLNKLESMKDVGVQK